MEVCKKTINSYAKGSMQIAMGILYTVILWAVPMKSYFFNIDIVGSCNLRCPSCPVGNWTEVAGSRGFMNPETLGQILDKAQSELKVTGVGLFNWAEPMLHPQLPNMVMEVQSRNIPCFVSSNLNISRNTDDLMRAEPVNFRISVSGFTQDVYSQTHRGGHIERVKENMIALAEAKQRQKSRTQIHVLYHRYLHNLEEEEQMAEFAHSLGFQFQPVWAFFMPLEKSLLFDGAIIPAVTLSQQDLDVIESLALPLKDALEVARKYKSMPCSLREDQITLDWQGQMQLCCAVYNSASYGLADYLSTDIASLQHIKQAQSICKNCMSHGGHIYSTYGAPEFDQMAEQYVVTNQFVKMLT